MKMFKKTLAAALVLSALAAAPAMAAGAGDAKVLAAGEATLAKTQEAVDLLEKGGDKEQVLALFSEIRQSQKEFRYEQTERLRQKAGDSLRHAREELESGDSKALADLKTTLATFQEMMKVYKAAH
jgi:large subunit ribosomal protein L7/L12